MEKKSPERFRRVLHEIRTSLPGQHVHTSASEPESDNGPRCDVHTGQDDVSALVSPRHRLLGIAFWFAWLAWGVYTWWFVDRAIADFVIATVVWTGAFIFSVIGIPVVRQIAGNHRRQ
jgi:hypothetical protein